MAKAYNINEVTLGDWIHFWNHGIKRQVAFQKKRNEESKKPIMRRKKFSPELQAMIDRNTLINNKNVKIISQNKNTIKTREEEENGRN